MAETDWRMHRKKLTRLAPTLAKKLGFSQNVSTHVDRELIGAYEGAYSILGNVGKLQIVAYLGLYFQKHDRTRTLQFWVGVEIARDERDSLRQLLERSGYDLNEINQKAYRRANWLPHEKARTWYVPHMDTSSGHNVSWFGRFFDVDADPASILGFLKQLIERLRRNLDIDTARVLLLIGGSDQQNGDYSRVLEAADSNRAFDWSTPKDAGPGDLVLLYIAAPISAVIAKAIVLGHAYKTHSKNAYPYQARVGQIMLLPNPLKMRQLRRAFPKWDWLAYPRRHAVVPPAYSGQLWALAHAKPETALERSAAKVGAGFSSPEQNRKVEQAAIRKVKRLLKSRGYSVISRELDRIGYDLEATRGKVQLHVEVKGVSGGALKFLITSGEKKRAQTDKAFRIVVVTRALTKNPSVHEFSGDQLAERFEFAPVAFMAELV